MRISRFVMVLALAAGCGDNIVPEDDATQAPQPKQKPTASSSVGGSQVSHSKSFMLVTSVANSDTQIQKSSKNTLHSGAVE